MKSCLFLIAVIGRCVGQDLLPQGPVEAVLRKNVTFQTLVDPNDDLIAFVWSFTGGSGSVPIVTVTPTEDTVGEGYEGRVWVNRTNGVLTLGPLMVSDRGFYRATMVTPEGTKTGETMLQIVGYKWNLLPEGPVDAVSGTNVTFRTLMDPRDEINATAWFFSGGRQLVRVASVHRAEDRVVFEGYRGRVTVNWTNGFLTLGPLTPTDSGEYHVNILTAGGLKSGETQLRVLEPVSDVTIRANVSDTVEIHSTVLLTCSANGSSLTFSWSSGTTPIMADDTRLVITEEASSSVLTISSIQSSDLLGPIYCTAANQLESQKSAPFNLTVIFPPPALTHPTQSGLTEEEDEGTRGGRDAATSTTSQDTTTPSHGTTTQGLARSESQDASDAQCACVDKLQAELVEMRSSFERSLRQMESRTHSLLWSVSRRLERLTEAAGLIG